MSTQGVKAGTKPVQGPTPAPRPTTPAQPIARPAAKPEPRPGARPDTTHFKPGLAGRAEQDDLKAKIEAVKRAQAAKGDDVHGPKAGHEAVAEAVHGPEGDHGENGVHGENGEHHGHHPGQVVGEASRSANHLTHGAQGLKSAAQEAQALKAAAQEAQALKAAAQEAEALAMAAREASAAQKAVNVVRDAARVAGVAEAGFEAAKDAVEATKLAEAGTAATGPAAAHGQPHGHAPGKLGKGLGVIGIAGGGIQIALGISQLRNGETGEGVKNLVVGGGFAGSGVAELTLATKVATKVAAPLAGAASVVEGGYDVYQGIKKGDGKKVALGGAKGIGGALLAASPFVAGSVIGAPVGVVMAIAGTTLIAGAAVVENWDTMKGWAKSGAKAVRNVASKAWEGAKAVFSGW